MTHIETITLEGVEYGNPGFCNTSVEVSLDRTEAGECNRAFLTSLRKTYPHLVSAHRAAPPEPEVVRVVQQSKPVFDKNAHLRRNREAIAEIYREKLERRQPMSRAVIRAVAEWFELEPEDLTGKSRISYIVSARFVAMRMLFDMRHDSGLRRFSYPMIGRFFGGRDHSTVIHAMRTFDDRARAYPEMLEAYEALR